MTSISDPPSRPYYLYRHYNADNVLLYVGQAVNPCLRNQTHQTDAFWYDEVRNIKIEVYPDKETVNKAEIEAMINERPLHNKKHNPHRRVGPGFKYYWYEKHEQVEEEYFRLLRSNNELEKRYKKLIQAYNKLRKAIS